MLSICFLLKFKEIADRSPLYTERIIELFKGCDSKDSKIQFFSLFSAFPSILKKYQPLHNVHYNIAVNVSDTVHSIEHPVLATSSEHYRLPLGMNQDCICEEGCCLSDAHFTHCRSLKLCSECGRGLQGRWGGAKALLFKELNASLAIGSQTIREIEGILLEPDISPFPINCVCLLFCLPVLFLRSYSGKSLPPPPPEC